MRILLDTHCWLWLQSEPERFSADVLHELGLSLGAAGRGAEAITVLEKALRLDPNHRGAWRTLGDQRTLCLINLDNQPASISLDVRDLGEGAIVDLLQDGARIEMSEWPAVFNLRPYGCHWLRIEKSV